MWIRKRTPSRERVRITLLTGVLLLAATVRADVQVSFTAEPSVLRVGEAGRLLLSFYGLDDVVPPQFPDVQGLDIQFLGPATQITFVRGQMQRTLTLQYQVVGRETGAFTLGPYVLPHNGQDIDIPAVTLTIVKETASAPDAEMALSDRIFARISFQPSRLYHRQVFEVTLSIYSDPRINTTGQIGLSDLPATGLSLGRFHELSTDREVVNGKVYTVRRFRARTQALSAGEYTLAPTIRMAVVVPSSTRRGPLADPFEAPGFDLLFGRRDTREVQVQVDPVTVTVHPLPAAGRPESFNGAVGLFQFEADVQPRTVAVGEPLTLTMRITGQGNIATLSPAEPRLGDEFRAYDLRMINENINPATAYGTRVFEQVVIPGAAGVAQLPALEFSYFDPETQEYNIERIGPFDIEVTESADSRGEDVTFPLPRQRGTEVLGTDILYLKPAPARLRTGLSVLDARHPAFWALQGVPLLVMALAAVHARRRIRLQRDRALARRIKAPRVARQALRHAETALQDRQRMAFHEAAWQALADYFGNRLNLPPGEISSERILASVVSLDGEDVEWIARFCATCDRVRFGGVPDQADMTQEEIEHAHKELDRLRFILRRCERLAHGSANATGSVHAIFPLALLAAGCMLTATTRTALSARPEGAADSPTDPFEQAAVAYDEERWEDARAIYASLAMEGVEHPSLFYNLGNTYYRQEAWALAMLQYRRAWWLNPSDPAIQANLALAQRKSRALLPEYHWFERGALRLGLATWSLLFSIGIWTGSVLMILSFYWIAVALPVRRLALVAWLLSLMALPALVVRGTMERNPEAVVITGEQTVRFAPLSDATEHFTAPPGTLVRLGARRDGWVEIQTDGRRGWLPSSTLTPLFPLRDTNVTAIQPGP